LDGRPQLKYFEAGMDLRLSTDPYESFRIFQGRMLEQYLAMSTEFNFLVMDANQHIEKQQGIIRELVAQRVNLATFHAERPVFTRPPVDRSKRFKREALVE
jgi:dTMP kinase